LDEANGEIVTAVVAMLVNLTALRGDLETSLQAAETEAAIATDAAGKAETAALRANAEATDIANKRLDAGDVVVAGSLLDQFRLRRERAKAETEAAKTMSVLASTTKTFCKFKADRACPAPHHPVLPVRTVYVDTCLYVPARR
jgi:hypothetical protein